MKRRVFLLGLDGGSWNVFDRLFAHDVMPNFQRLCADGVKATLESTMPPITPVAWTSLMTGVNPGKHGIFAFDKRIEDASYLAKPVNRMDIQVPTIFDYYREDAGLISLNLPMSYPATPIAGKMITGMMTPQRSMGNFEHPDGLMAGFGRHGIDYVIDPLVSVGTEAKDKPSAVPGVPDEFIPRMSAITDNRMRAVRLLMDEQVFICVIVGTDRLQHVYWDDLVPPDGGPPRPFVADYYRQVDRHIGEVVSALEPEDTLMIVSDHGFVRSYGLFQTNEWLRRHGWLKKREAGRSPLYLVKLLLNRFGITRAKLGKVMPAKQTRKLQMVASHIDWAGSEAVMSGPFAIRVNLAGRETFGRVPQERYEAFVDEIITALRGVEDDAGRAVIQDAYRCRDLYWGDQAETAGDIVFNFRDDLHYSAYTMTTDCDVFAPDLKRNGDHRVDGIFAAAGGGIHAVDETLRFSIWDVLPTLMHVNGRSVPGVCDGRVLAEILSDDTDVTVDDDWRRYQESKVTVTLDQNQEDEITERLRALGYLADD
jgi:predicted AlkP superfamily phosphohydrolase/phosphomutase